jgi:hypothetical protein
VKARHTPLLTRSVSTYRRGNRLLRGKPQTRHLRQPREPRLTSVRRSRRCRVSRQTRGHVTMRFRRWSAFGLATLDRSSSRQRCSRTPASHSALP